MQIATQLSSVKQIHPIFLCSRHIMPQVFFQQCIDPLGMAVCLRMICCGEPQLRTQELEEFPPKVSCEFHINITDYVLRQAKVFHHMTENRLVASSAGHASGAAMNNEYLENRSTTTKMDLHSWALGNPEMKSMEALCHGFSGMGRGCSNPTIFFFSILSN